MVKRDGRRELFDRGKMESGIIKALEKRMDIDKIRELADKLENKLRLKGKGEIQSRVIGTMVLSELKRLDKVAYLRFASVYRDFKEPGDFARELQILT